ncbi:MAG: hypothetical protein O7J95_02215 [Planctomycetota bacterium]|nr:hypothetical protein [Planctomycetota bacterium]
MELYDGTIIRGNVVERGDNSIELEVGGGSRRVFKRDIESVRFYDGRNAGERLATDRVEFKDGHKIDGEVKLIDGGKRVRVTLSRQRIVVFLSSEVKRIRWKSDLADDQSKYFTRQLAQRIEQAIDSLSKPGEVARAEKDLKEYGIFAIDRLRAIHAGFDKKVASGRSLDKLEAASLDALLRVIRAYDLRKAVTEEIQRREPDVYEILTSGTFERKDSLLQAIYLTEPEGATDLALFLIKDPTEDERIRAVSVEFLRRMQMNQALVDLYNGSDGQLKLVASIALARNRILLGIPTLLEALDLPREELRSLAARALRQSTGKDFRYRARGAKAARDTAIRRWESWWESHREEIEKETLAIVNGGRDESSTEWQEATRLWRQAYDAWREKDLLRAQRLFEQALDVDPNFVKASISVAVLYYLEFKKPRHAEKILSELLDRARVTMTTRDRYWTYLELANVYRLQQRFSKAVEYYEEALGVERQSIAAERGLADSKWYLATGKEPLKPQNRLEHLLAALDGYDRTQKTLRAELERQRVLRSEDLVNVDGLPFETRLHNRDVLDVRRSYETEIVDLYLKRARIHSLMGRYKKAFAELRGGIDYLSLTLEVNDRRKLESSLRSYLGLTYENLGEDLLALKQYRQVLRKIDENHKVSKQGIERLRKKSNRRGRERSSSPSGSIGGRRG